MRKLVFLFTMVFAMLFVSCGEDEPEQSFYPTPDSPGEIDTQVLDALKQEGSVAVYDTKYRQMFRTLFDETYDGWLKHDKTFGHIVKEIRFQDGKVWERLGGDHSVPVDETWPIMRAYYTATNKPVPKVYITSDFDYDKNSNVLKIGSERYSVLELTTSSITLGYTSKIEDLDEESKEVMYLGVQMDVATYGLIDTSPIILGDNDLTFNTAMEYCRYLSGIAREYFGRYIDLDKIYKNVFYDDSPIDLDEYDRLLDRIEELSKKND